MKLDLLILAIAPVATIILWIYLKDKYDKEPIRVLSKFFILGILVSTLAIYAEEILIKRLWRGSCLSTAQYPRLRCAP